jgi:ComF family protein
VPRFLRARTPLGECRSVRVLRRTVDALIAATLAPSCVACKAPLDRPTVGCVCPACWVVAIPTDRTVAPSHAWTTAYIKIGISAGRYEGALREIIHAFKYEGRRSLADPLGRMIHDADRSVLEDCDYVVPVPLHPWRRMRRGFNQARDLAKRLECPVVDALWRIRATASQMALPADARRTNIRGAFVVSPLCGSGLYGPPIENRVIVLVDDVRTTGATLDECAKVLLAAGARDVRALTVAFA